MTTVHVSPWLISDDGQRAVCAKVRLFCFHYAGTGGSIFRPWANFLPDEVELIAVQLPGREDRIDEPLVYRMEEVTDPLVEAISPLLDKPFAFFGHSIGAVIGFDLARALRKRELREPELLIASSQNAPQIRPKRIRHRLPDDEFNEASPQQAAGYHKEGHCL